MFNLLMPATWKYSTLLRLPEISDGLKECFYSESIAGRRVQETSLPFGLHITRLNAKQQEYGAL